MGSLGANRTAALTANNSTTTQSAPKTISQEQFRAAMAEDSSADRRRNLAELMYPATAGTVLQVSDRYSLTKTADTPGGIWVASDGERLYGDDAVKLLSNTYKISASSVTVTGESNYVFSHGHKPRGYGEWAFLKNRDSVGNDIIWVRGKFSEAKKAAQKEAAKRGWSSIYIGS